MRFVFLPFAFAACTPQLGDTEELPYHGLSLAERDAQQTAREHLEVLLDARAPPVLGQACGYSGEPPPGRRAVQFLVEMGREDLLQRALKAPSAEGRMYASLGLVRLGRMTCAEAATRAANELAPVHTCMGCIPYETSAREALAALAAFDSHRLCGAGLAE